MAVNKNDSWQFVASLWPRKAEAFERKGRGEQMGPERPLCHAPGQHMERCFLVSVAPVLAGAKPGALVSFHQGCAAAWHAHGERLCEITGLSARVLHGSEESVSLLLYHRERLAAQISSSAAEDILAQHGYPPGACLEEALAYLRKRFVDCRFPHEIGVFLGYPPEDVAAFIRHGGKGYLCCRYWKVYYNEQRARELFKHIDAAKAKALRLIARQVPLYTAARLLRL